MWDVQPILPHCGAAVSPQSLPSGDAVRRRVVLLFDEAAPVGPAGIALSAPAGRRQGDAPALREDYLNMI